MSRIRRVRNSIAVPDPLVFIPYLMEDIREVHRGRAESAPEKSVATERKKDLNEVANFKGSHLEQRLLIYCKQNRIPYNRLTEEEKQSLIRIGSKADFMRSHISRRGKRK